MTIEIQCFLCLLGIINTSQFFFGFCNQQILKRALNAKVIGQLHLWFQVVWGLRLCHTLLAELADFRVFQWEELLAHTTQYCLYSSGYSRWLLRWYQAADCHPITSGNQISTKSQTGTSWSLPWFIIMYKLSCMSMYPLEIQVIWRFHFRMNWE